MTHVSSLRPGGPGPRRAPGAGSLAAPAASRGLRCQAPTTRASRDDQGVPGAAGEAPLPKKKPKHGTNGTIHGDTYGERYGDTYGEKYMGILIWGKINMGIQWTKIRKHMK